MPGPGSPPRRHSVLKDADRALDNAEIIAFADLTPSQRAHLTEISSALFRRITEHNNPQH
jgi:hypothetical protein